MTQDLPVPAPDDEAPSPAQTALDAVATPDADAPAPRDAPYDIVTEAEALAFSTETKEPPHFSIDGLLYDLKDWDHLNDLDEARLTVLVQRTQRLLRQVETLIDQGRYELAEGVGIQVRAMRVAICKLMTTAPEAVILKLSNGQQRRIVEEAMKSIGKTT